MGLRGPFTSRSATPSRRCDALDLRRPAATGLTYTRRHDRDRHAADRAPHRRPDVPPLHRRGVVRLHQRPDLREPQPGRPARRHRALPAGQRRRRRPWPSRPPRRPARCGAARPPPSAARSCIAFAELMAEHKERLSRAMTREMGKVLVRGPRRRPGRHRHRLPDGRRGPPHVRRHGARASCPTSGR